MFKWVFFTWTILSAQVVNAQVKDTVRGSINYRRFNNSPSERPPDPSSFKNTKQGTSFRFTTLKSLDTLRDAIDYRKNYSFYKTYKYKVAPIITQYFGFQLNAILHEITKPDSTYTKNPFAITYSINHRRKGFGIGLGYGYTEWGSDYRNTFNNEVATINSRLNFRITVDRKSILFKKLILGYGFDYLLVRNKYIQKTFINGFVDAVNSRTSGWGIGPRFSIAFKLNKWVYVGTESSFYFKKLKTYSNTQFTGLPPENETHIIHSGYDFLAPVSFFAGLKIN